MTGGVVKIIRKNVKEKPIVGWRGYRGKPFQGSTIYLLLWFKMDNTSVSVGFYGETKVFPRGVQRSAKLEKGASIKAILHLHVYCFNVLHQ